MKKRASLHVRRDNAKRYSRTWREAFFIDEGTRLILFGRLLNMGNFDIIILDSGVDIIRFFGRSKA